MSYVDYGSYIKSPEWRAKADAAKWFAGYRCQLCNDHERPLHAHHRTYANLGNEQPGDITVLCDDCHELFEKYGKRADCRRADRIFTFPVVAWFGAVYVRQFIDDLEKVPVEDREWYSAGIPEMHNRIKEYHDRNMWILAEGGDLENDS